MFVIFDVVVDVVRCAPGCLASLELAGVHPVVLPVPGVGELCDVLQTNSRLPATFKPLLQRHSDVDPRPLLLYVLLSRGVLGIFRQPHYLSLLFTSLPNVFVPLYVVSQGLEVLQITIADQTEEELLLSCGPVLVTKVVRDGLSTSLEVHHVHRVVLKVYVLAGCSNLHNPVTVDIDPPVWIHAGSC